MEIYAIMLILAALMHLLIGISGVIFNYINGYDTMGPLLWLLYPVFMIAVGWELTKLKYWAWVCAVALLVIGIVRTAYDVVIYGAWQDILAVATLAVILVYFLTAKTRSQLTWR